ncbi:hypothetical protein BaRGS_00000636 [Batillaria attramentaria]|uniref:Uncharacterized protein n=1 Tax=Batillaria attramentaria TaxID=370345 RepID=A0ABD0M9H4_9CAEN
MRTRSICCRAGNDGHKQQALDQVLHRCVVNSWTGNSRRMIEDRTVVVPLCRGGKNEERIHKWKRQLPTHWESRLYSEATAAQGQLFM